jgi:hypothetical protein
MAAAPDGTLVCAWLDLQDKGTSVFASVSTDGGKGKSFTPAQKLGLGSWLLNAFPMDVGMVAVDSKNGIVSVWRREEIVYTCTPGKPEQSIEVGQQPWIASGKGDAWCTWLADRPEKLRLQDPTGAIRTLAQGEKNAVLAASETGDVAVTWTGRDGLWAWRMR